MIRDQIGAVAAFKQAVIVNRLPKTRSGKVLRKVMRKIADGEEYRIPSTIDDPGSLEEIQVAVSALGYGKIKKDPRMAVEPTDTTKGGFQEENS